MNVPAIQDLRAGSIIPPILNISFSGLIVSYSIIRMLCTRIVLILGPLRGRPESVTVTHMFGPR